MADPGDADRGEEIYGQRCVWCHGEDGDAFSPAAERLNPMPRDFTLADYKFKTTAFDDIVPNDDDLFRMIRDGMPGTAMPSWNDMLGAQDMWDLVAFIKIFGGLEEEAPSEQVDYGAQIASSAESVEQGRQLFHDQDRCSECHGEEGKGNATKKLKDDAGERTWPRNMTKPWTFRASNEPKDIFTRIRVGIAGTQMPSFADPRSKKLLSIEESWHIANYVASLAKTAEVVRPENTVVKAQPVAGDVPQSPDDPTWQGAPPTTFLLVPQIIAEDRLFTPSNDTITVRAYYNDIEIALLVEWDDRTKSIPGDPDAEAIADPDMTPDAVAVQFPVTVPEGMEKPYFLMGDARNPVNLWRWSSGTTDTPASVTLLNGTGLKNLEEPDVTGVSASGVYRNGTWRVVMRRPLVTQTPDADIQFTEGRFIPISFFAWDGSNGEGGTKHTMTTWYWILLAPAGGMRPLLMALAVIALVALGEIWWAWGAVRRQSGA